MFFFPYFSSSGSLEVSLYIHETFLSTKLTCRKGKQPKQAKFIAQPIPQSQRRSKPRSRARAVHESGEVPCPSHPANLFLRDRCLPDPVRLLPQPVGSLASVPPRARWRAGCRAGEHWNGNLPKNGQATQPPELMLTHLAVMIHHLLGGKLESSGLFWDMDFEGAVDVLGTDPFP